MQIAVVVESVQDLWYPTAWTDIIVTPGGNCHSSRMVVIGLAGILAKLGRQTDWQRDSGRGKKARTCRDLECICRDLDLRLEPGRCPSRELSVTWKHFYSGQAELITSWLGRIMLEPGKIVKIPLFIWLVTRTSKTQKYLFIYSQIRSLHKKGIAIVLILKWRT